MNYLIRMLLMSSDKRSFTLKEEEKTFLFLLMLKEQRFVYHCLWQSLFNNVYHADKNVFKTFLRKLYCDTSQAYPAIVIIANPRLLRVIGSSNEAHTVDA